MEPANVFEGYFLKPMIQKSQDEFALSIDIVVADMGYLGSNQKKELREKCHTAVLTKVRDNMFPPGPYADSGCPECPEGIPLSWDGYDPDLKVHCYIGPTDRVACRFCPFTASCYQEVSINPLVDEHRFGIIPLHAQVAQKLLQQIRPQVERGFENDKNKLYLNRFFINSLKIARILGHLSDASQVLLLFAGMKTNTKAKAQRLMKSLYTQLTFDF
ncbi:MAG: hypothetical protein KKH04_17415 [Proteobacteria bacterium]|nr:hypothetical protein [Pseudomonadota bacterium]